MKNNNKPYEYNQEEANEGIGRLEDRSIKLLITSPAYNLGKAYEKRDALESYLAKQRELIAKMVNKVALDGSVCWQSGNYVEDGEIFPLDIYYYQIFKELGLKLRNRIIWRFGHGLHAKNRFSGRYETVLWFTMSDDYIFNLDPVRIPQKYPSKRHFKGDKKGQLSGNPKGKNPSDFWELMCHEWETGVIEIPNVKNNHPEKTAHPCQFPIELVERFILALTNEGDEVYDPYAGVASAVIAAIKNGRYGRGGERDAGYVAIGEDRIEKFINGQLPIRALGTKIHTPTKRESKTPIEWES